MSGRGGRGIGLALSGGGIRAAVFHLGVMRRLAQCGRLGDVAQVSTVSGGSLLMGLVFARSRNGWPSSAEFLDGVYPFIRETLVSGDLLSLRSLGVSGVLRENICIANGRAGILARQLRRRWGIELSLADLPRRPVWHINATNFETGKNWRFSRDGMGDWQFGRLSSPDLRVADAIAASAAVPYAIGALRLQLPEHGWWRTHPVTGQRLTPLEPKRRTVRLWDGGAYENMALEPLFKPSRGLQGCDVLVCSDASGPLGEPRSPLAGLLSGNLASPRLFDIAADQIRSLRSRMLVRSMHLGEVRGVLLRIGTLASGPPRGRGGANGCLDERDCAACLNYPTNRTRIAAVDFERLARHGYEVAEYRMGTADDPFRLPSP